MLKKEPIIVIGGSVYADIDVLACTAAYKQYLQLLGYSAHALITGPWNQTIPSFIKNWPIDVEKKFLYENKKCTFVLVDFSDPQYVDSFVDLNAVVEVFDHHYGHEDYWKEKIGNHARIEKVGACATLIWEQFKAAKIESRIIPIHANLLYIAIMANTLDFRSTVTQQRDITAAREILPYTQLPCDWKKQYYAEIEAEFLQNPLKNILEDTKTINSFNIPFNFGQIELANACNFLQKFMNSLVNLKIEAEHKIERWVINIVSIEENCSYLYCNCLALLDHLNRITSAHTIKKIDNHSNLLITSKLWLRKEILREMIIYETNALNKA